MSGEGKDQYLSFPPWQEYMYNALDILWNAQDYMYVSNKIWLLEIVSY